MKNGYLLCHGQQTRVVVSFKIRKVLVTQVDQVGKNADPNSASWSTKVLLMS